MRNAWLTVGVVGLLVTWSAAGAAARVAPGARVTLEEMRALQRTFRLAAGEVAPSVVTVVVDRAPGAGRSARQVRMGPDGRPQILRGRRWVPAPGAGTGVVISADGLIVTSTYYTTGRVKRVLVLMPDGTPYEAKILGRDEGRGVVLLRIEPADVLPAPRFVGPDLVRVGQWVMALGRTYGEVDPSVNVGIVSATARLGGRAIQTDAGVSPINYGGPLVDLEGRVLGICVPLSPNPRLPGVGFYDSGIGFAVPVTDLLPVLPRLLRGEVLRPGFLGIQFDTERLVEGAAVRHVVPNTAAARAGIKAGDVIVELDGKTVRNGFDLMNRIGRKYALEKAHLKVKRGDDLLEMDVTLGERPRPRTRPSPRSRPSPTSRPAARPSPRSRPTSRRTRTWRFGPRRSRDQGSGVRGQGSGGRDQGSGVRDQGSGGRGSVFGSGSRSRARRLLSSDRIRAFRSRPTSLNRPHTGLASSRLR